MKMSLRSGIRSIRRGIGKGVSSLRPRKPNQHLPASAARLEKIQNGISAYIRPSFSDEARLHEFNASIYVSRNELTKKVVDSNPSVIIDIGANIGLSSLSLSLAFPSVTKAIGVEAEFENHAILAKNYELWSQAKSRGLDINKKYFEPIYAVASDKSENLSESLIISRLDGGVSLSGTFRFTEAVDGKKSLANSNLTEHTTFSRRKICLNDLFEKNVNSDEFAVLKVDIEGGEHELFRGDCSWLAKTVYLTVEIHDRFGLPHSSRNIIRSILDYDFAVVPGTDVLHCYNRKLLGL